MPETSPGHPADVRYPRDHAQGRFPYTVYPHPQITVHWELTPGWDRNRGRCKESFVWCGDAGQQIVANMARAKIAGQVKRLLPEKFGRNLWIERENLDMMRMWWKISTSYTCYTRFALTIR